MKIAVPVSRWNGWLSPVSNHFGHAPFFAVVDCVTRSVRPLESRAVRQPGECAPIDALVAEECEAVLCRHLGRGALERCRASGLKLYVAEGKTLADARDAFMAGSKAEVSDEALCQGEHDHHHHHGDEQDGDHDHDHHDHHHHHDHGKGHHRLSHHKPVTEHPADGPVIILPDPSKA